MYLFPLSATFKNPILYHLTFFSPSFSYSFFEQILKICISKILANADNDDPLAYAQRSVEDHSFYSVDEHCSHQSQNFTFGTIPCILGQCQLLPSSTGRFAQNKNPVSCARFLNSFYQISLILWPFPPSPHAPPVLTCTPLHYRSMLAFPCSCYKLYH